MHAAAHAHGATEVSQFQQNDAKPPDFEPLEVPLQTPAYELIHIWICL